MAWASEAAISAAAANPASCALRAVQAGVTAEELRRVIEDYASDGARTRRSYEQRRQEAVDFRGPGGYAPTTPLLAAHRARHSDLVGVLLEAGADTAASGIGCTCTPLTLAIHHHQTDTLRALLRSGRHHVEEAVPREYRGDGQVRYCRPLHHAVRPPRFPPGSTPHPPPHLESINVLVREFGADVNGHESHGARALHFLAASEAPHEPRASAVDALLSFGADLEARDDLGQTPLHTAAYNDAAMTSLFLSRGASPDVRTTQGYSPLMYACLLSREPAAHASIPILLRASSRETWRAVQSNGVSALDYLCLRSDANAPWCRAAIDELMLAGVSVRPLNAHAAVPHAARLGDRLRARAAALAHDPTTWQTQERMVHAAFDHQEAREAAEGVRRREARVAELERALAEAESGSDGDEEEEDDDSDGEEDGSDGEEDGSEGEEEDGSDGEEQEDGSGGGGE